MKIKLRHITMFIIIAAALFLGVYDIFPFCTPERGDTISEVILFWSLRSFTIPVVFGAITGHFFLPYDGSSPKPKVLFSLLGVFIAFDFIAHFLDVEFLQLLQKTPFVSFALGMAIGVLFWPQSKADKV